MLNRRVAIGLGAGLVGVALVYSGAAWWAGISAEQALKEQEQQLSRLPYFKIKAAAYHRGWLSAEQEVTLELSDSLTWPYQLYLKYADKPYQPITLSYRQHVRHGPFPLLSQFDPRPYKAVVTTELLLSDDMKAKLKPFFGDQPPVSFENRVGFNNDGEIAVRVPSVNYEEAISGIKIGWKGLHATFAYNGGYDHFRIDGQMPGLALDAAGKATVNLQTLRFGGATTRGVAGLLLGDSHASLQSVAVDIKEATPFAATLENISYHTVSSAQGDFINADGQLNFGALLLDGKRYGPAALEAAARHLHAPTLAKLDASITQLQREALTDDQAASKAMALLKDNGLPLLRNDPELQLKSLSIKLPEGEVRAKGDIKLTGFVDQDLEQPVQLLNKISAHADLRLPKPVVEAYVRLLVRNVLISRSGRDMTPEQVAEMDNLARQLVQGQVANLIEQKLIRDEGQTLVITAAWAKGRLDINGQDVPLPWQTPQPLPAAQAATN